jgi:DNA-3-methyladenine glycosylase I
MEKRKDVCRCPWCGTDEQYVRYHDEEWGVPEHDARRLFEALVLDGAQAGLSWLSILRRRAGYREVFSGFDPEKMAAYTEKDVARLLSDARIIRNRRKIESAIANARAFLAFEDGGAAFSPWLWDFVDGKPLVNHWKSVSELPSQTDLSVRVSKELKKRGFSFVGPVNVYAVLQSAGLVNDHLVSCFRWAEVAR